MITSWKKLIKASSSLYLKHERAVLISAGLLVLGVVAGGSYWWYRLDQHKQASFALVGSLEDFEKMLNQPKQASLEVVSDLEQAFLAGASLYASTQLAFFFEAFAAEIQLLKGNHAEALALLENALQKLAKTSPFYYLYATKIARMQIDSVDKTVQEQGHKALQSLSEDQHNPQRDMAQYYRGYNALLAGNRDQAATLWASLPRDSEKVSTWVRLAEAALKN